MLKLSGISESLPELLDMDDYVPLQINWGTQMLYPRAHWMLSNTKSILDIALDPKTRLIRSLTVTLVENRICNSKIRMPSGLPCKTGTPMFQKDDWPSSDMYKEIDDWPDDRILDEQGTFYVYLGDSHIFVKLFPDKQPSWVLASGRVCFVLDQEDCLCSFEVKDLEPEEVAQIKVALKC